MPSGFPNTPKTDAMILKTGRVSVEWADFARSLERENAQLRDALNEVARMAERLCEPNEITDYARGLTA